jgi:probable rRNA maturation factor
MPADVVDEAGAADLAAAIEAAANVLLDLLERSRDELAVLLVGDARMQELNREWRGKNRPTDVLSFGQDAEDVGEDAGEDVGEDAGADAGVGPRLLGDIVISVDTARRQAGEGGWTDVEETTRLLLHGLLHLLGHDHEEDDDARRMREAEADLVAALAARGVPCASDVALSAPGGTGRGEGE